MQIVVRILEWLVLLPLWRRLFKPKALQIGGAVFTGFVWLIVIVAAAGGGSDDPSDDATVEAVSTTESPDESEADRTDTVPSVTDEVTPTPEPTDAPTPVPTESPKPANQAPAAAGSVAEAEHIRIYLNDIADPWISDNQFIQPTEGKRYVAFDVTVEDFDNDGTHLASSYNFHLSDSESFAYDPTFFGPEPALSSIEIHAGEKTRGWVTFEVNEGALLTSLKYDPNLFTTKDIAFTWP